MARPARQFVLAPVRISYFSCNWQSNKLHQNVRTRNSEAQHTVGTIEIAGSLNVSQCSFLFICFASEIKLVLYLLFLPFIGGKWLAKRLSSKLYELQSVLLIMSLVFFFVMLLISGVEKLG